MSSRVSKITVSNLKAISELTADFAGCTAIITGGNNKGKSSFLRSLPDRIHGVKPEVIVKKGEKEGYAEWLLTTGEKFIWSFDNGTEKKKPGEKLTFITSANIKGPVTRELALRYFPPTFNVDDFLNAQPKKQKEILQKLVGLDFTDADKRYDEAYLDREGKNRRAKEQEIILADWEMPEDIAEVNLDQLMFDKAAIRNKLNKTYQDNVAENAKLRKDWEQWNIKMQKDIELHNSSRHQAISDYTEVVEAAKTLARHGINDDGIQIFIIEMNKKILPARVYEPAKEPTYIKEMPDSTELNVLDEKILNAQKINQRAQAYKDWKAQEARAKLAIDEAAISHGKLIVIEEEKMAMIKSAKMPEGFGFAGDGITYTDLPFTREQLSSSGIYIAALKLAAMTLGEVRVLHFDASFLDNPSLAEIEAWANSEQLQLLIEMPDRSGGDISYELLNCEK